MKLETILNLILLILGIVVAIAPWTFAPVCMVEMRCYFTRDVETAFRYCLSNNALMTLGFKPTFPNTGYGYIEYDKLQQNQ